MLSCASQLLAELEPESINSMNRTPRSAMRRATRHCQPKPVVCPRSTPYKPSVASVSWLKSNNSGASRCMPNAVSNERIRASKRQFGATVLVMLPIHLRKLLQLHLLQFGQRHSAAHVGDRSVAGHDVRPLMAARQKVGGPGQFARIRILRSDDGEGRQVLVFGPQAVADPRAHAGPGQIERAGVDPQRGLVVARMIPFHRADHAQIVDA